MVEGVGNMILQDFIHFQENGVPPLKHRFPGIWIGRREALE